MFVRDWMSAPQAELTPSMPVGYALATLRERNAPLLPVVEAGRLVGTLREVDAAAAVGRVREVMAVDPPSVSPREPVEHAAQAMCRAGVPALCVVDEGRVIGLITLSDIARAFCDLMGAGERGGRVAMVVPEGEDLLSAIARRTADVTIRGLAVVHDAERHRWEVVLRVRGRTGAWRRPVRTA